MSTKVLFLAVFGALVVSLVAGAFPAFAAPTGTLTAQCVTGGVYLEWGSHPNANSNGLQKGDSFPSDPNNFWAWLLTDGNQRSYIDYGVTPGQVYTYRVKYRPELPSNEVSIVCGTAVTPTPYPTPFPTWTPVPQQPTVDISANPSYTWNSVGTTTLSWNSVNASNCVATSYPANSQWSGSITNSGSRYIYGITSNTSFVIDCYSPSHVQRLAYFTMNAPATPTPYPTWTPTPTPYVYGTVSIDHSVRNLTRGGEGSAVTAYNGDRVQFIARITTGNQYISNVYVRDWLPQYVSVVSGTTTVDGNWYADGITSSAIRLGTLSPNRTYVVRVDGMLNGAPTMTVTNTFNVHADGMTDQTRNSNISVVGSTYVTPTPTPWVSVATNLTAKVYGRNVTLGQSAEFTSVVGHANDTLDIILHVRGASGTTSYNTYVTDMLPAGLNYISGTTRINNIVAADGITSSGLNIGTLYPSQESIVAFSVKVDPSFVPAWGQVDLRNTSNVRADGVATISVQLPITLGTALSIAAISQVKTGPADTILLSVLMSVVVAGLYAMYTNTATFGRRQSLAEVRTSAARGNTVNFLR